MIKKTKEKGMLSPEMFDLIKRPVITEKAMKGSEFGHVTFLVPVDATKTQVKAAVEAVFKVKVIAVNTLRQIGKQKNFRGVNGVRSEVKKAIVTLEKGQSIDVTAGV